MNPCRYAHRLIGSRATIKRSIKKLRSRQDPQYEFKWNENQKHQIEPNPHQIKAKQGQIAPNRDRGRSNRCWTKSNCHKSRKIRGESRLCKLIEGSTGFVRGLRSKSKAYELRRRSMGPGEVRSESNSSVRALGLGIGVVGGRRGLSKLRRGLSKAGVASQRVTARV